MPMKLGNICNMSIDNSPARLPLKRKRENTYEVMDVSTTEMAMFMRAIFSVLAYQ